MVINMTPLDLSPHFEHYLWGGTYLRSLYGITEIGPLAEAWILSCYEGRQSIVKNIPYHGQPLSSAIASLDGCLGSHVPLSADFPVLIKFIDAADPLSIQVHPDDTYARAHGGSHGKTEMWYAVDAAPGAFIYHGFTHAVSEDEFAARIADGSLTRILNRVEMRAGDCVLIEAGTLHAIGAGLRIAEIQQNSNATYRVFDFGRVGLDGKPRALHIKEALDVTRRIPPICSVGPDGERYVVEGGYRTLLTSCAYFTVTKLELSGRMTMTADGESFVSLVCMSGYGHIETADDVVCFSEGSSLFLSAASGAYALNGDACILHTEV